MCVCVLSCFSRVRLFATLWTAACQAPLPGILQGRILEWVAMLLPGDLPNSGIELRSLRVPAMQANSSPLSHWEAHSYILRCLKSKRQKTGVGKDIENWNPHILYCWWEFKMGQSLRQIVWQFLKWLNIELTNNLEIPLRYMAKRNKTYVHTKIYTQMFMAALLTIAKR